MNFIRICFFAIIVVLLSACGGDTKQDNSTENTKTAIATIEENVSINGVSHYIKKMGTGEPILVLHGGPGLFHNYLTPHFEKLAEKYQIIFTKPNLPNISFRL